MKTIVFKLICLFFPITFFFLAVIYFEDPANITHPESFAKQIAGYLAEGYNVTNLKNLDDRLLKKALIERITFSPKAVIFGSSRVMSLNEEILGVKSLNLGVSNAQLYDIYGLMKVCFTTGINPKRIIIGLEPWMLNDSFTEKKWLSLREEYLAFLKECNIDHSPFVNADFNQNFDDRLHNTVFSWISVPYFQESVKSLFNRIYGQNNSFSITKSEVNSATTRLADGSIEYPQEINQSPKDKVDKIVSRYLSNPPLYTLENFDRLSPKLCFLFVEMIKIIKLKKLEIICFLPPYHPDVYEYIRQDKNYKKVMEAENFFRMVCKKYDITVVGSYDPYKIGISSLDFFDELHLKKGSLMKIFPK